jgi:PHD/YefM family antitoxin component YafN of YafNO toxin-antitoxin module
MESMKFILREDTVSLTDFARNTKKHTEELAECGRPRILTQNGEAAAVVLSPEAFEKMAHDAEEYELDLRLRDAIRDVLDGKRGIPAEEAFERLRKRTALRRKSRG